jgi:choice-of-anchor A domain-containing protein
MKLSGRIHHFFGLALAIGAAGVAHATSVVSDLNTFSADVRNYNLVTLGNATLNGSSDTQGGIAIGGNLAINGAWTIASNEGDDPNAALYINSTGTLTLSGTTTLNNGFASIASATTGNGWTWNSPNGKDLSGHGGTLAMNSADAKASIDPDLNAAPTGWSWSTESSSLTSISSDLAGASVGSNTITVDGGGNLDLNTTQTSGIVVFDLDASQLGTT